jgi:glycosyltransferase involved in cell wall biosynthesis
MKFLFPYLARWDSANRSRYHQLLTQLSVAGHQVYVLKAPPMALGDISSTDLDAVAQHSPEGLTISEFDAPPALKKLYDLQLPKSKLIKKGLLSLSSVDQVRRFIAEEEIDVLLVYNLPQVKLLEVAECHRHFDLADDLIAMLAMETGVVGKVGALSAARYTQDRMLELADTVTVASSVLSEQISRSTFTLPNGADLQLLDGLGTSAWRRKHPEPCVGFVGAFEYWVDFELVLRVARRMKKINFLLVGGGRQFPVIEQAVKQHKLRNVFLTGPKPYEEAMSLTAAMDIGLIPFTRDAVSDGSSPLKLFEYAALRRPVISTPITEVKRLGADWVTFGYDAADFADAIEELLNDSPNALSKAETGRRIVEENYTWPFLTQQFLSQLVQYQKAQKNRKRSSSAIHPAPVPSRQSS